MRYWQTHKHRHTHSEAMTLRQPLYRECYSVCTCMHVCMCVSVCMSIQVYVYMYVGLPLVYEDYHYIKISGTAASALPSHNSRPL